jgi:hypothetical protein
MPAVYSITALCLLFPEESMPHCTVCSHPQHLEINQALLSGDVTQQSLCHKYGVSKSALSRHKDHLKDNMYRARCRLQEIREQGSVFLLNEALESVRRSIAAAEADNNYTAVFRGANAVSRLISQIGRLESTMKLETLHRLLTSPAWGPVAGLLPTDLGLLTGLHQALIDGALIPCPDLLPEISAAADLDPADPLPETRNSEPGPLMAPLRELQKILAKLDLTMGDIPPKPDPPAAQHREAGGKPAGMQREITGNLPGSQREMSRKLPGKTACQISKCEQNQNVKRSENSPLGSIFSVDPFESDKPRDNLDASRETLNDAQAAELAAYLQDFSPYANPPVPDPDVGRESEAPPALRTPHVPADPAPVSRPSRPPDFGNPGLFRQIKGTFC